MDDQDQENIPQTRNRPDYRNQLKVRPWDNQNPVTVPLDDIDEEERLVRERKSSQVNIGGALAAVLKALQALLQPLSASGFNAQLPATRQAQDQLSPEDEKREQQLAEKATREAKGITHEGNGMGDNGESSIRLTPDNTWIIITKNWETGRIEKFTQSGSSGLGRLEIIQGGTVAEPGYQKPFLNDDTPGLEESNRTPISSSEGIPLPDSMWSKVDNQIKTIKAGIYARHNPSTSELENLNRIGLPSSSRGLQSLENLINASGHHEVRREMAADANAAERRIKQLSATMAPIEGGRSDLANAAMVATLTKTLATDRQGLGNGEQQSYWGIAAAGTTLEKIVEKRPDLIDTTVLASVTNTALTTPSTEARKAAQKVFETIMEKQSGLADATLSGEFEKGHSESTPSYSGRKQH